MDVVKAITTGVSGAVGGVVEAVTDMVTPRPDVRSHLLKAPSAARYA